MKGKRKNDINVEGSGEMKRQGREKGWRSVNIKKINVKKNWKIGKKKDNDVDTDVAQLERSNTKYYASAFRYIQIQIYIKKKKE